MKELTPADDLYPDSLLDLPRPPARLWLEGALPTRRWVAIVGTRRADPEACTFTARLARTLASRGIGVVSGGAEGIDAAAHRGALQAEGSTLVVQAAPLHTPYPRVHADLFDRVLERGGWLSETAPDAALHKGRFLARNRLIAALAEHVIVVQAPARSGALSTARWALRLRRPLHVVPGAPWDLRARGGIAWLDGRAQPCIDADGVLRAMGLGDAAADTEKADWLDPVPEPLRPLALALSGRARGVDELVTETGWSSMQVQRGLVSLLAMGVASRRAGGWVARLD